VSWRLNGYSGSRNSVKDLVEVGHPYSIHKGGEGSSFVKGTGEGFFHATAEKTA
jgi:hypothetical protein